MIFTSRWNGCQYTKSEKILNTLGYDERCFNRSERKRTPATFSVTIDPSMIVSPSNGQLVEKYHERPEESYDYRLAKQLIMSLVQLRITLKKPEPLLTVRNLSACRISEVNLRVPVLGENRKVDYRVSFKALDGLKTESVSIPLKIFNVIPNITISDIIYLDVDNRSILKSFCVT